MPPATGHGTIANALTKQDREEMQFDESHRAAPSLAHHRVKDVRALTVWLTAMLIGLRTLTSSPAATTNRSNVPPAPDPDKPDSAYPLDGISLRPLLDGTTNSIRDTATSYWGKAVTVSTATDRLIYNHSGDTKSEIGLYDMRHTPDPVEKIAATSKAKFNRLKPPLMPEATN